MILGLAETDMFKKQSLIQRFNYQIYVSSPLHHYRKKIVFVSVLSPIFPPIYWKYQIHCMEKKLIISLSFSRPTTVSQLWFLTWEIMTLSEYYRHNELVSLALQFPSPLKCIKSFGCVTSLQSDFWIYLFLFVLMNYSSSHYITFWIWSARTLLNCVISSRPPSLLNIAKF